MVVTLVENVGELLLWEIISHPTCWLKKDKSRGSIHNVGIALINKVRLLNFHGEHIVQDAKMCILGITFPFFLRLSSNFAGWQNSVSQKILCFLFFDIDGFWQENDVTRLTAKSIFQVRAKQINNLDVTETNVKNFLEKLNCFRRCMAS